MKISKEARRSSRQIFRACLVDGKLDENRVRAAVAKIAEAKPRGYIAILETLSRLVRNESERQSALVESATELSEDMRYQLRAGLSKKYGRELSLQYSLKPDLLGGIRVRVGSDVWDGSVKARLEALAASLS